MTLEQQEAGRAPEWVRGVLATVEVCSDLAGIPAATIEDLAHRRAVKTELLRGVWHVAVDQVIEATAGGHPA